MHEEDTWTWNPADWDLAQITLVCLGVIVVFIVTFLFVGGCKHANCTKGGNYEELDNASGNASTGGSTSNMESLSLSSELEVHL